MSVTKFVFVGCLELILRNCDPFEGFDLHLITVFSICSPRTFVCQCYMKEEYVLLFFCYFLVLQYFEAIDPTRP